MCTSLTAQVALVIRFLFEVDKKDTKIHYLRSFGCRSLCGFFNKFNKKRQQRFYVSQNGSIAIRCCNIWGTYTQPVYCDLKGPPVLIHFTVKLGYNELGC